MFSVSARRRFRSAAMVFVCSLMSNGILYAADDADGYVGIAKQLIGKGDAKSAVNQLKTALQSDPGHLEARLLLGGLYLRLADGPAAAKEFERTGQLGAPAEQWKPGLGRALALQSDYRGILERVTVEDGLSEKAQALILSMRGHAHLALGEADEATKAYEEALAADADSTDARLGKARILIRKDQKDEARKELDLLIDANPDVAEAYVVRGELARQTGNLNAAQDDFSKAKQLAPNNVRAYVGHGLASIAQRLPDAALADVAEVRKRFGAVPFASYIHALAAFQKREFDEAQEQLQLVLRAMPSHLQSQLLYGVVSYAKTEFQTAEEYLTRVHSSLPKDPAVAKLLGAARLKLRMADRAIDALKPAADQFPEDAQLLALLGNAFLQAGQNSKGSEYMARAVELDPEQALLRTQLALGKLAGGDTEAAISELESAVELGQDLVQADVLLVLSYLNKKEYDKALDAALALEKRMTDSPIPYNLTGLAYLANKELDQADAKFVKALEQDPDFVVAIMNRARLALAGGNKDAAVTHYNSVLEKQSTHVGAMLGLAAVAQRDGDAKLTESWLKRAHTENPEAIQPTLLLAELYLKQGQALKASSLVSSLPGAQDEIPAVLRIRGMAQLQGGDFSSAVRTLQKLVSKQSGSVEGWFQLARAQAASGDLNGSRNSFERAIALDKDNRLPILRLGLGELELRAKDYNAALAVAEEMHKVHPDNAMAYEVEAAAYRGLGQTDKVLVAVEKAVRAEGNTKRVNLFAHSLSASGNPQRAVQVLQDWLRTNLDDSTSWTTLGMMQQQLGDHKGAVRSYEEALRITPDNPVILNNVAWLYHQQGDKRALEASKKAYEIAPERPEIVDTHGWILLKSGNVREGLAVLQQALVAAPRNAEIGMHVAEALRAGGRAKEAEPLLQRIIRNHPRTEWEQKARSMLGTL